jgi:hypothetical protein
MKSVKQMLGSVILALFLPSLVRLTSGRQGLQLALEPAIAQIVAAGVMRAAYVQLQQLIMPVHRRLQVSSSILRSRDAARALSPCQQHASIAQDSRQQLVSEVTLQPCAPTQLSPGMTLPCAVCLLSCLRCTGAAVAWPCVPPATWRYGSWCQSPAAASHVL